MGVCSDQSQLCAASKAIQCCTNGTLQVNAEMLKEYVILAGVNAVWQASCYGKSHAKLGILFIYNSICATINEELL